MKVDLRDRRTLFYIGYCIVVIILIIAVAIIFRPSTNKSTSHASKSTTSQRHPAGSTVGKAGNSQLSPSPSSSQASGTAHPSTTQAANGQSLNNTGPGDLIAPFLLAALVGAWYWRRKVVRSMLR